MRPYRLAPLAPLASLSLLTLVAASPAPAQQRTTPSIAALPVDARVRVTLRSAPAGAEARIAYLREAHAGALSFRAEGEPRDTSVQWGDVVAVELSDGIGMAPASRQLGRVASGVTLGAALGWISWHSCRNPEEGETEILSCIVAPGRLGTAVRSGAWMGLGLGTMWALTRLRGERWQEVDLADRGARASTRGSLLVRPAGKGVAVGWQRAF